VSITTDGTPVMIDDMPTQMGFAKKIPQTLLVNTVSFISKLLGQM
jgi:hypothetical protein